MSRSFADTLALNLRATMGRTYVRLVGSIREPAWILSDSILPSLGMCAFVLLYRWDLFSAPRQDVLDEIMSSISSGGMPVEKQWEKSTYHIVRFRGS